MDKQKKLKPVNAWTNNNLTKASVLISMFLIIYIVLIITTAPKQYILNIGDIADIDIDAPANMVDKAATEIKRKEAENMVQPIYRVDLTVQIELEKQINMFFNQLEEQRSLEELSIEQKLESLENSPAIVLDKEAYILLLNCSQQDLLQVKENVKYLINQILNERLSEMQLESKKRK